MNTCYIDIDDVGIDVNVTDSNGKDLPDDMFEVDSSGCTITVTLHTQKCVDLFQHIRKETEIRKPEFLPFLEQIKLELELKGVEV